MKILHVISSVNPLGGGPIEGLKQIIAASISYGHEVEVATLDSASDPWVLQFPFKVYGLGPSWLGYGFGLKIRRWLVANSRLFDAVVVEGLWQFHGFAVWMALRKTGIPYFVYTHGMLSPWFKSTFPFKHLKKWLYWNLAEYYVIRDARAVLFTAEEEKVLARQSFSRYRLNERIVGYGTVSPSGNVDSHCQAFFSKYPALRKKRLVLFLGRMHAVKGVDLLLNAFAEVAVKDSNLHLVLAGPDQQDMVKSLQLQAAQLGIADRITWPGMLRDDLKWGAFYASEVFCLPSHQENFGIVVAEALACGKPVLISNKVNIWREIEADSAGFVDTDTVEGTVRNLERWLALSAAEYTAMSERAVATFNLRFHIDRASQRLLEIIRNRGDDSAH